MADYSEDERAALAKAGHALPDGSYPVRTCEDAMHARESYGRAPEDHRPELVRLINRREQELNCGRDPFHPAG